MTLDDVNALSADAFVASFGDVAEHSRWVAERAGARRPFADREAMIAAFQEAIAQASRDEKLALLRAHPDLAGRAARVGDLTDASTSEQAAAGLDQLTDEEFERFETLNADYKAKFGFPFILAVKGATKTVILDSYSTRINGTIHAEFQTAIEQVKRIVRFRLEDLIDD